LKQLYIIAHALTMLTISFKKSLMKAFGYNFFYLSMVNKAILTSAKTHNSV